MQSSLAILSVALGGAIGSALRYLVSVWFVETVGPSLPWGTFAINVTGSFAIGVVLQLAATQPAFNPYVRLFLAAGVLGGYTTFSTFAFETLALGQSERMPAAILYAAGSVLLGVAAAALGMISARFVSA